MSKSPTPGHERLHAIVERLALSYRGALPWVSKDRTREMLIEDCIKAADIAVADPLLMAAPEMLKAIKVLHDAAPYFEDCGCEEEDSGQILYCEWHQQLHGLARIINKAEGK